MSDNNNWCSPYLPVPNQGFDAQIVPYVWFCPNCRLPTNVGQVRCNCWQGQRQALGNGSGVPVDAVPPGPPAGGNP